MPYIKMYLFHVHSCWLSSAKGSHAIWTFVAPMLVIILVRMTTASLYSSDSNSACIVHPSIHPSIKINIVFLVLVLKSISISKYKMAKQSENGRERKPASKEMQVAK